MTIVVTDIGSNTGTGVNTVTITVPVGGVPSGATILICVSDSSTSQGSVTDSVLNSYSQRVSISNNNNSATGYGAIYASFNNSALVSGNTIVFTLGVAGSNAAVNALYVTGTKNVLDDGVQNAFGSSAAPSVTSGTPSGVGNVFLSIVSGAATIVSFTQDSSNAAWASPPGQVQITAPVLGGGTFISLDGLAKTYAPAFGTSVDWGAMNVQLAPAPIVATTGVFGIIGAF